MIPMLLRALALAQLLPASPASSSSCSTPAPHEIVLRVDDYVGRRSSADDAAPRGVQAAIDAAIASARARGPTALQFSPGKQYRLASPNASAHRPVLSIINASGAAAHGLRIDGCGAELIVTTPMAGLFSIQNASRLAVGNLSVDYDPLPMTQGRVTAIASSTQYTVQLEPGFPSLMEPQFVETVGGGWGVGGAAWVIVKERAMPTVHKNGTLNLLRVGGWKDRGGGVFDVTLQLCANCTSCSGCTLHPSQYSSVGPAVGDPVVHLARFDGYPTFGLGQCEDCHFDHITIHASPAGTWVGVSVSGLVISSVSVVPKAGRWHSTSADGVFVLDSRVGPVVKDSEFLAIGDDAFIVKTFSGNCLKQQGATYTLVSHPCRSLWPRPCLVSLSLSVSVSLCRSLSLCLSVSVCLSFVRACLPALRSAVPRYTVTHTVMPASAGMTECYSLLLN